MPRLVEWQNRLCAAFADLALSQGVSLLHTAGLPMLPQARCVLVTAHASAQPLCPATSELCLVTLLLAVCDTQMAAPFGFSSNDELRAGERECCPCASKPPNMH